MDSLDVLLLYNRPELSEHDPDWASEAGVLEAVDSVERSLGAAGHRVRKLAVSSSAAELLAALAPLVRPDVVFNLCEGLGGVGAGESQVAGLIELLGWPLTGSGSACLALARDKMRTKLLLTGAVLPTPQFIVIRQNEPVAVRRTELESLFAAGPLIVKPAEEDASLGIGPDSVVTSWPSLERQIESVGSRYGAVLVERFIIGREINAAVIGLPEPQLLPLAEINFANASSPLEQVVTYDAKWTADSADFHGTPVTCPAKLEPVLAERISRIALAAFQLVDCRQYARIDLRLDVEGNAFILEVNANPDLSPSAGLARAARVSGLDYDAFLVRLAEQAAGARPRD